MPPEFTVTTLKQKFNHHSGLKKDLHAQKNKTVLRKKVLIVFFSISFRVVIFTSRSKSSQRGYYKGKKRPVLWRSNSWFIRHGHESAHSVLSICQYCAKNYIISPPHLATLLSEPNSPRFFLIFDTINNTKKEHSKAIVRKVCK